MGRIAAPLKAGIKEIKQMISGYSFVSISGGAIGPNPKLEAELTKCTGIKPAAVIDMHIADILAVDEKPGMKETSKYEVTSEDIKKLIAEAAVQLK